MFKPAEDLDKTPAKVTISLIDGITPNGVKPFTEADLLEAAVTFEEMAPLIDAAINGDPLAIAELSPAVVTRKPITVEQLASLNEEQPKPVAPTPIERLNIEFPNRRKSTPKAAAEMPPLTESQRATVDEIHASLVSSGIKGVGKPEVAEYVTKREALTKQATLLENGTWYRGKAHDVADKNREVARLDYEFARRSDQVGLETSTPVLNVLGLGGVTRAATTQAVGKVAKGVAAGKSVVPNSVKPVVTAEARVNGSAFSDVNQTARVGANVDQPTLIAERIVEKSAQSGKALPNGNMGTAHAEVGAIQQAFDAGATAGADMTLTVTGKAVCGFCRGDVAAMAKQAELKSLVVYEEATGNTLYWQQGMKSLKKAK
ncbi:hypothetical protein [Halioxenophilus aromaticivorans]|uniref:cytidine deaminase-like fold-containing protein n=2 Tax=Halioxenophilus aromaticivorans TaxID=1306992 RepID=UPI0036F23379